MGPEVSKVSTRLDTHLWRPYELTRDLRDCRQEKGTLRGWCSRIFPPNGRNQVPEVEELHFQAKLLSFGLIGRTMRPLVSTAWFTVTVPLPTSPKVGTVSRKEIDRLELWASNPGTSLRRQWGWSCSLSHAYSRPVALRFPMNHHTNAHR